MGLDPRAGKTPKAAKHRRACSPIPGQMEFDWNGEEAQPIKPQLLDAIELRCGCLQRTDPDTGKLRRGCSCANRLRAILRALDSFQQNKNFCWPSVQKLAARANCSDRTTQRLLRLAEKLEFIETKQKDGNCSHYKIDWNRIWHATDEGRQIAILNKANLSPQGRQNATQGGWQNATQNSTSLNSNEFKHDGNSENSKAKEFGSFEEEESEWHCHIEPDQLTDIEFLINVFTPRAWEHRLVPPGGSGEILVLAAAIVARKGDLPGGLFWTLLRRPTREWLSQDAAESARLQIKQFRSRARSPTHIGF